MTSRLLLIALAAALLSGGALAAQADDQRAARAVVVVDARSATPQVIDAAKAAGAEIRVPRTATEQLSVTHYLAAKRFDVIVAVGLDRRVAVTPVAQRYPDTQIREVTAPNVAAALR